MFGRKKVDFKGTKNGIVLYYAADLTFDELLIQVEKKLKQAKDFFKGAHMIGIDGPPLEIHQEEQLSALIEQQSGMKVLTLEPIEKEIPTPQDKNSVRITFEDPDSGQDVLDDQVVLDEQAVLDVHVDQQSSEADPELDLEVAPDILPHFGDLVLGDHTVFYRGTLRSGKRLDSKGHIIVIGDVNPGAELCAKGNIVVIGALRGFAFAGSEGDDSRCVVALRLQPTQLRIGSRITRPPDDGHKGPNYPEIASIKDQHIIIEPIQ